MLPEFDAALDGHDRGRNEDFRARLPGRYHGKEVAGKTAEFALTVQSVAQPILPEIDAEFARKFGIASGSVDELRAEITANLKLELKRKIEAALKQQVMSGASHRRPSSRVPKSLVELEAENLLRRTSEEMKQRGARERRSADIEPKSFARRPRSGWRSV